MSTGSTADINAGRAVIGVSLDDSKLQQQMDAVSAKMRAAAAGTSASMMPGLTKETLKPSAEYESSLRTLESVYKTGAVSQDYFRQQLAELATQYTATATPAQKFGVELSKLDGDMKRGDITTDQYAAKLEGLTADFWRTSNATQRFEGTLVALERDFTRGTLTQDQYRLSLQNAHREFRAVASPVERYHDDLRQLDAQLKAGAITQAQYEQATRRAKTALVESESAAKKTNSAFAGLASQVGAYVAGFASIATAVNAVRSVAAEFEKIEQESLLAEKLGMAEASFQGLKIAAQRADVEFSTVETAMVKMSIAIGKVSLKGEESTKWLDRIGVTLNDLAGLSADKQFIVIADAMRRTLSETEMMAAATEIFGKGSTDMIRLLGLTKEKLDDATNAAIKNGQAIGGNNVEAIKQANDAVDGLSNSWEGLKRSVATSAAPLSSAIDALAKLISYHQLYKDVATGNLAGMYQRNSPLYNSEFNNGPLEQWRNNNSKEAMTAREKDYAAQFEAEIEANLKEAEQRKTLADERAAAEKRIIDQTNEYGDQFSATMEASDRRMKEVLDTREFLRKKEEELAKQTDDYGKMFEASVEAGAKETTGAAWEKERERLASRSAQGTFSGWRIGQMYNAEQIDKEQLAELKKINEAIRDGKKYRGEKETFYT